MEVISALWNYVLPFLVVLTVLVFVHELGHYLMARRYGVRVEVFSVGFGPELYGWNDRHGTRWKISAIPFGGYVRMFGERLVSDSHDPPVELDEDERKVAFGAKRVSQRSAIVFAGPFANFLFALVILAGTYAILGQPFTPADVGQVLPGSAAEAAGFRPGDVIKSVDGSAIERFEQVQRIVQVSPGVPLAVIIERDGKTISLVATPSIVEIDDRFGNKYSIGQIGISRTTTDMRLVRHDPITAVWRAGGETVRLTGRIFDALWQIITGVRTAKELGGPLRIAQMSGDMAQAGLVSMLLFAAILSINLGLINLFPIPLLDGGHLVFFAAEAIRGRPVGERAQEYGFRLGLFLVLSLMLFVTWNDLVQMRVVAFFVELVT